MSQDKTSIIGLDNSEGFTQEYSDHKHCTLSCGNFCLLFGWSHRWREVPRDIIRMGKVELVFCFFCSHSSQSPLSAKSSQDSIDINSSFLDVPIQISDAFSTSRWSTTAAQMAITMELVSRALFCVNHRCRSPFQGLPTMISVQLSTAMLGKASRWPNVLVICSRTSVIKSSAFQPITICLLSEI